MRVGLSAAWAVACVQGIALLSGCGGSGGGGTQLQQPSITSFSASPAAIEAGTTASVSLTAVFVNGTGTVMPGSLAITSGTPLTLATTPTTSTTYTLTVTGASGTTPATDTTTFTVDPVPTITSFSASPTAIEATAATSVNLTATFTGAATGTITPGDLSITSGGSVTVNPTTTTAYTLTVTPPVGTVDATSQPVTVTVDPVPTITSFSASPTTLGSGGSVQFSAVFANGTGLITGPGISGTPISGNNTPVSVTAPTVTATTPETYTLTVSPPAGTIDATQSATVNVSPVTISSFTANPTQIEAGSSTGLIPVFSGGTGEITAPGGYSSPATSGTPVNVSPTATTTYTLSVTPTGGGTAVTQPVTVTVYPQPTITSFTSGASSNTLVAGNSTTLTAEFSGGTAVITPGPNGSTGSFPNVTSGTPVTVNPTIVPTVTYTLTVTPPVGTVNATQTLTLTVENGVTVCTSSSCSGPAISNLLLGMNLASWYDVVTAPDTAIVSAFQGAGIAAVRWPGGSWSDGYHWDGQNSYPTDSTIAAPSGCTGVSAGGTTTSVYPNGDDTFANFVSDIVTPGSLDLAVTADYGSDPACTGPGEPSEAAGWAAYAQSLGTPIHYMTIGNEEYGNWELDLHTRIATTDANNPTVYACEVSGCTNLPTGLSTGLPAGSSFYSAIKSAVETAGGSADTTLVGVDVDASSSWDPTVLANAAGFYDFVEYHYYPQSSTDITSDTPLVQQYAQQFTQNIKTIQSELATAGEPNTPIYVGEISSNSSNPGTQGWSITQGLYAGQILGEAMNDGVARLTWWIGFGNCLGAGNNSPDLYGWQNTWGALSIFSDGTTDSPANECDGETIPIGTMSPTAQAFNLFQNVLVSGEYPQTATVAGDTTDVRAYAATHSGGYALVLFNLNETTAQTASVSVGNQASSTGVTVITYDKEIYDQTDPTCQTDPGCSYSPTLTYPEWAGPDTSTMGSPTSPVSLPLTLTLQPWSMNVVIVQ